MNIGDYLILAGIVGYCLFLLFRKKKPGCGGCSGCSGDCAGCAHSCDKKK